MPKTDRARATDTPAIITRERGETFTTFVDLARAMAQDDIRRAHNLARARAIARVTPGTGPRIAR